MVVVRSSLALSKVSIVNSPYMSVVVILSISIDSVWISLGLFSSRIISLPPLS